MFLHAGSSRVVASASGRRERGTRPGLLFPCCLFPLLPRTTLDSPTSPIGGLPGLLLQACWKYRVGMLHSRTSMRPSGNINTNVLEVRRLYFGSTTGPQAEISFPLPGHFDEMTIHVGATSSDSQPRLKDPCSSEAASRRWRVFEAVCVALSYKKNQ